MYFPLIEVSGEIRPLHHAPRGNASADAPRQGDGRGASRAAYPTRSVGTIINPFCGVAAGAFPAEAGPTGPRHGRIPLDSRDAFSGTGFSREDAGAYTMIVPTLCVVMHPPTLCVKAMDAERPGRHPHAERGDDQAWDDHYAVWLPAPSRLKPVPLRASGYSQSNSVNPQRTECADESRRGCAPARGRPSWSGSG